jgi:CheY-like chemotaxis protein
MARPSSPVRKENIVVTKVLIVDDDPVLCEFIQEVLTSEKMHAEVTTDSMRALARLRDERFDVIFLDMRMPSLDGIEVASCIRSTGLNQTTPLVMITGDQDHKLMQRAFQAGVNLFLCKPVDRSRIMRLIHAADNFIQAQRRRYTRVKVSRNVSLECGEFRVKGTSVDLSMSGMSVKSSGTLPIGSAVRAALELHPGKPPVQLAARVVRTYEDGSMGLQIEKGVAEDDRRFESFLLPMIQANDESRPPDLPARSIQSGIKHQAAR